MKDIRPLRADEVDLRMKGCVEGNAQFCYMLIAGLAGESWTKPLECLAGRIHTRRSKALCIAQ